MNEEIITISSGKGATGKVPSYVKKILEDNGSKIDNIVDVSAAEDLLFGEEDDK